MTEMEIIKELFVAASTKNKISVILADNAKVTGVIRLFDGEKIFMGENEIALSEIIGIEHLVNSDEDTEPVVDCFDAVDYSSFKLSYVTVATDKKGTLEGIVFDYRDGKIVLITETSKAVLNAEEIVQIEKTSRDDNEENSSLSSTEHELSGFETAVLDGDKKRVDDYLLNSEKLITEGYTEEEATRMSRAINVPLPWNDDETNRIYNQARRLLSLERNRGNLAYKLFREYLQAERIPHKYRVKAVNSLIEILSYAKSFGIKDIYEEYKELILHNQTLCYSVVKAYVNMGLFDDARKIIDETGNEAEYGDILFSLTFYENHKNYDFSNLPGLDSTDSKVGVKEIRNLLNLPDKISFIQLLTLYIKNERYESFFALLELFMPYAKNDAHVVSLVGECIKKDFENSYLKKYLPEFTTLWLDKELAIKYLSIAGDIPENNEHIERLVRQCKKTCEYAAPNELENAIIQENYQLFDVLRGNDGIIISMGYSSEELENIKKFDVDTIKYGNKCAFERLIIFEGNRNGVAESIVGTDFLRNPAIVGKQLFSLLWSEGNVELLYELYNYTDFISNKLILEQEVYLNTLLKIGKREEFWKLTKDNWLSMDLDKEMLTALRDLAVENEHEDLANLVSLRVEYGGFNEFEQAIIDGSVPKVRSFALNAELLLGMGYATDEIKLIQESVRQKIDFTSSDNISVANRLYTFQKNKNRAAEFYYKLGLENDKFAAVGLFSILSSENRYSELCNLFEKHLCNNAMDVTSYKEAYLNALFYTEQYDKYVEFWKDNRDVLSINPLFALSAFAETDVESIDIKEFLSMEYVVDNDTVGAALHCIKSVLKKYGTSGECVEQILDLVSKLYNTSFAYLSEDDFADLKKSLPSSIDCQWPEPSGNGLKTLLNDSIVFDEIHKWCRLLFDYQSDSDARLAIIRNIVNVYGSDENEFHDYVMKLLMELKTKGVEIPEELNVYLYPKFNSEDEKESWLDQRLRALPIEADESDFDLFCKLADETNNNEKLYAFLVAISTNRLSYGKKYLEFTISKVTDSFNNNDIVHDDLLFAVENQLAYEFVDAEDILGLYEAYLKCGRFEYAYMADAVLRERFNVLPDQMNHLGILKSQLDEKSELSFFSIVKAKLESDSVEDIDHFCDTWKNYLRITEEDIASLGEIKDFYNTPEKWTDQSLESLAKNIVCNESYPMYWKLLNILFAEGTENIRCNVAFHLALTEKASLDKVLLDASKLGLMNQTCEILKSCLTENSLQTLNKSIDTIGFVIDKYIDWFKDSKKVLGILVAVKKNTVIRSDLKAWTNVVSKLIKLALAANVESRFFELYKENFKAELESVNAKFLCWLILDRPELQSLIINSLNILRQSSDAVPYKKMIIDLASVNSSRQLSDLEQDMIRIAMDNDGNGLDETKLYSYYLSAVSQGEKDTALEVLGKIGEYYPNSTAIDDVKKYEAVSKGVDDEDVMQIYESEFALLKGMTNVERSEKMVLNMIPGELYLKSRHYEIESVLRYGNTAGSPASANRIKVKEDSYRALDDVFEPEKYPGLVDVFLKSLFTRRWYDFVTYNVTDESINEILRSDSTIKGLMFKKSYEVLKGAVLAILDSESENEEIIDRSDALIAASGGIKRSKNYLRRIQKMSEEQKDILRRVFSVRIESKTLRDSGIVGSTILNIPGNELVAFLIGMLESRNLAAVFDNSSCMHSLMMMPSEQAVAIAEIYSTFFYQGIDNIFTKYIAMQTAPAFKASQSDNPFEEKEDYCKEFRKRYLIAQSKVDSAQQPAPKPLIKTYELNKMEYLYEAIIHECRADIELINPTEMDYLSVITYLFNKRTVSDIRNYIWKMDSAYLEAVHSMVLILLEQYQEAYNSAQNLNDEQWKNQLLQIIYRDLFIVSSGEEKNLRHSIQQEVQIEDKYFLGRFTPINASQVPGFVEKMHELRSFMDELVDYIVFNGMERPQNKVDDEKLEAKLARYQNIGKTTKIEIAIHDKGQDEGKTVADIVDTDYIDKIIKESVEIEPVSRLKKNPDYVDSVGALKYFVDTKGKSQNQQDILRVRDIIRWVLITKMDKDGFERELFNHVLEMISDDDSITKIQWESIAGYLLVYFEKIGDIIQLSRVIENDIMSLKNVGKVSNAQIKFLRKDDVQSWNSIIDVLSIIAGMDYVRLSEAEQINRLSACRQRLFVNGENKNSSLFDPINGEILRLLTNYIMKLRHNPELSIDVIGEGEDGIQTIMWENGGVKGTLFAVISNIGGADCQQVTVTSYINMARSRKSGIRTIYSGEKIPFMEFFDEKDLLDGKVTWNVELSYYDSDKDRTITVSHESKAEVIIGGEPLNLGTISTGNPARGKNFVGRKRELTMLRNRYSDIEQLPSMLIRGLKRSGKSSIIIQFSDEIRKQNKILVSLVDGQIIGGEINRAFIDKVLDGLQAGYRNNPEYRDILEGPFEQFRSKWKEKGNESNWISELDTFYYDLSAMFGKKILVIIDEMESIFYSNRFESIDQEEMLYSALRALIQRADNYVSFIFCGSDTLLTSCLEQKRESQMFQTLQYVEVGRMNYADIQEIFRQQSEKYDIEFTKDSIDTIWQFTHGLVWYAKLLGYLVINNILANDLTIRKEVNRADIVTAVQMLINGEIGTDKYDLVDASLNSSRVAIVHAMASIMPDYNKELSLDEICTSLQMLKMEGYTNPRNGEKIDSIDEKDVQRDIDFLEKMQFVDANASRTKYQFTAELYRLFFREDKRLHLFEERSV